MRNQFLFIETCSGSSHSCPWHESSRARAPPGMEGHSQVGVLGGFSPIICAGDSSSAPAAAAPPSSHTIALGSRST